MWNNEVKCGAAQQNRSLVGFVGIAVVQAASTIGSFGSVSAIQHSFTAAHHDAAVHEAEIG